MDRFYAQWFVRLQSQEASKLPECCMGTEVETFDVRPEEEVSDA